MNKVITILLISLFFIAGIWTLPDYGINWDTINHLPRGQVYLHYFLTGNKDFSDLPKFEKYSQKVDALGYQPVGYIPKNRISLYQQPSGVDFNYFMERDGGHPPLSDELSSVFNFILFQKLGIINDIDSYRVYSIFLASMLIGLIYWWTNKVAGKISGIFAAISLSLYPLFWSESHFNNEKDTPETVYISFLLFSIWYAIKTKSPKWIIISGFFAGLALGTKLNVVFVPVIIVPWLLYIYIINRSLITRFLLKKSTILLVIVSLFIPLAIFFLSWPYLWPDPISHLHNVLSFYKDIGITQNFDDRYLIWGGFNIYPLMWIFFTTPIVILILSCLGLISIRRYNQKENAGFWVLIIIWLLMPIVRVSMPHANSYGGIRQIMEYVPAMAIVSGIGANFIYQKILKVTKRKFFAVLLIFVLFVPHIIKMITIHPNENVYFNILAGGLKGAYEKQIDFAGNSFGSAYREGMIWINQNAEPNSKLAYGRELIPNIPMIWVRQDMILHNSNRSAFLRKGEYIITLNYIDKSIDSYFLRYLYKFLKPVHQVTVDGAPILTIWKNDEAHINPEYLKEFPLDKFKTTSTNQGIVIQFDQMVDLYSFDADYSIQNNCSDLKSAYVRVSIDGINWNRLPGVMPKEDWGVPSIGDQPTNSHLFIPFASEPARFLEMVIDPKNACLSNLKNIKISGKYENDF